VKYVAAEIAAIEPRLARRVSALRGAQGSTVLMRVRPSSAAK